MFLKKNTQFAFLGSQIWGSLNWFGLVACAKAILSIPMTNMRIIEDDDDQVQHLGEIHALL